MRDGCGRVQGQVVCRLPRPHPERVQRVRQQLVERSFGSPSTGFLEVSVNCRVDHVWDEIVDVILVRGVKIRLLPDPL